MNKKKKKLTRIEEIVIWIIGITIIVFLGLQVIYR